MGRQKEYERLTNQITAVRKLYNNILSIYDLSNSEPWAKISEILSEEIGSLIIQRNNLETLAMPETDSKTMTSADLIALRDQLVAQYKGPAIHVKFTHSKDVFCWPPQSLIKKLKRFFGIKPKYGPFV